MIELPNPFKQAAVPLSVDEILDISFRRAFKKLRPVSRSRGDKLLIYKAREISRIQTISDTLTSRLDKVIKKFPNVDRLDPFYRELLDVIAGVDKIKHSLGALQWASKLIKRISRTYIARIKKLDDPDVMIRIRREALGRISSVIKRISPEIDFLRSVLPALRNLPDLDTNLRTVIIAGMPNTGKSTLLSRLTTKVPEIAPYPFTTKGLIIGHGELSGEIIQFIDTPGLLDRPLSKRNKIELQAIVALKYLRGIIMYIFDPTEICGYSIKEQISLFEELRDSLGQRIIAIVNKADLEGEYEAKFEELFDHLREIRTYFIKISAEKGIGLSLLKEFLSHHLKEETR